MKNGGAMVSERHRTRWYTARIATLVALWVSLSMVDEVRADETPYVEASLERGQVGIGVSFTGGPFMLLATLGWLGLQIDLEPRLALVEGERITRHLRLRITNEILYHGNESAESWAYGAYRPSVGVLIADERSESAILPFFSARGGVQMWFMRSPALPTGDLFVEVSPYFPIGGGIEFPKNGPVMFHFELGALLTEALWFAFPGVEFGWLPIYFEIGAVFQPLSPRPAD